MLPLTGLMVDNIEHALEVCFAGPKALHWFDWKHAQQKMTGSQFWYSHSVMTFAIGYYLWNAQRPFKQRYYLCKMY